MADPRTPDERNRGRRRPGSTEPEPIRDPDEPLPEPVRVHTVQQGETLSQIGRRYGVDYLEIARVNKIGNPDLLNVGQQLVIPG